MHSFRIRYIVLGLLVYIQSAFCRTCGTKFDDIPSSVLRGEVVFEGVASQVQTIQDSGRDTLQYDLVLFKVKRVFKGDLPRREGNADRFANVLVGRFQTEPLPTQEAVEEDSTKPQEEVRVWDRPAWVYKQEPCLAPTLEVGSQYVVFLNSTAATRPRLLHRGPDSPRPYPVPIHYPISAFPVQSSKSVVRQVRDWACENCTNAKSPTVSFSKKILSVSEGKRLQLQCKVKGSPPPQVHWFFNGNPIPVDGTKHVKITNNRKGSKLRVRKAENDDTGTYGCQAENVLGSSPVVYTQVTVLPEDETDHGGIITVGVPGNDPVYNPFYIHVPDSVYENQDANKRKKDRPEKAEVPAPAMDRGGALPRNTHSEQPYQPQPQEEAHGKTPSSVNSSNRHEELCEQQTYCLNGGICYQIRSLGHMYCRCKEPFDGQRCAEKKPDPSVTELIRIGGRRDSHSVDRARTITGLVIGATVVSLMFIAAYIMSKKKRNDFRKRREQKLQAAEKGANGSYKPVLPEGEPLVPLPPPNNNNIKAKNPARDSAVQTEDILLSKNAMLAPLTSRSSDRPSRSSSTPDNLPRHNTAPSDLQSAAARDSPNSGGRPRLQGVSATPDFALCRPQRNVAVVNAIVESGQDKKCGQRDLGIEKGELGGMIEEDAVSDYDNPPSDLEVNMESEADVAGLDASGDEVEGQRGGHHASSSPSSHSSPTTSSPSSASSIGEEIALFQELARNPRVPSTPSHTSQNSLSWGDDFPSTQPAHMDVKAVPPPSYPSPSFNRHSPYNTYPSHGHQSPNHGHRSLNHGHHSPNTDPYSSYPSQSQPPLPPPYHSANHNTNHRNMDNNMMANHCFPNGGSGSLWQRPDEPDYPYPYDPDPDATVV